MPTDRAGLDYGARAWADSMVLERFDGDAEAALAALRGTLGEGSREPTEFVAWLRAGLPSAERPDDVYERMASGGSGEWMFASGRAALARVGYGALADGIPDAVADRFAGLGCPWRHGIPEPGAIIVDLGCGSGVDAVIAARAAGPKGRVIGVDTRDRLFPGSLESVTFRVAPADATGLPSDLASLVVANGLPPLMAPSTAGPVIAEARRLLISGGQLRALVLVAGPDVSLVAVDDTTILNAVRCGKPLCVRFRSLFAAAGFDDVDISYLPSPFADGFDAGPISAVLVEARRP